MEILQILKILFLIFLAQSKKNNNQPPNQLPHTLLQTAQFDRCAGFRTQSALPSVKSLKTTVSPVPFTCCLLSLLSSPLCYFTTFGTQLSPLQLLPSGAVSPPLSLCVNQFHIPLAFSHSFTFLSLAVLPGLSSL